jgi:hypothetical protein
MDPGLPEVAVRVGKHEQTVVREHRSSDKYLRFEHTQKKSHRGLWRASARKLRPVARVAASTCCAPGQRKRHETTLHCACRSQFTNATEGKLHFHAYSRFPIFDTVFDALSDEHIKKGGKFLAQKSLLKFVYRRFTIKIKIKYFKYYIWQTNKTRDKKFTFERHELVRKFSNFEFETKFVIFVTLNFWICAQNVARRADSPLLQMRRWLAARQLPREIHFQPDLTPLEKRKEKT